MSQTPPEVINVPNVGIGTGSNQHPPQHMQNQASLGVTNFVDGSGPIFSMYLEMATEDDKKMVENWKADADGILIFTGLFSAAVASLISVSIQDIRPNPQDTTNFYLANIYQTFADPNRSNISNSLPSFPPTFSPPNYAVWVNSLWFMSLVVSLTCALLATLLQQWARRYLKVTQPRYSPHKRARVRAFFFEGVGKYFLPLVVDALPTLLHISLYLFFAGLVVFLCNVDLTIFKLVLSWVGVCTAIYGCFTFIPIFCHDSPYYTPLTSLAWPIVIGTLYVVLRVLRLFTFIMCFGYGGYVRLDRLGVSYRELLMQGMERAAEETALKLPSEIDTRAFMWTFDSLDEDHELERFFSGLPSFRTSKMVNDPLQSLTDEQKLKLVDVLIGLSGRTLISDLLPEPVKSRRDVICARAIDPADIPQALRQILGRILSENPYGPADSAGIARLVRAWGSDKGANTPFVLSAIASSLVAKAKRRDAPWFAIASDELGVPESVLRDYAAQGDSLSLAILIHITRQQFNHYWEKSWPEDEFSIILKAATKFHIRSASPKLRHEFCALWNEIVLKVQDGNYRWMAFQILGKIRNVYIDLHRSTSVAPTRFSASTTDRDKILLEPSSYPLCNVPGHHPDPTPPIRDVSFATTSRSARAVPPHHDITAPISSSPASAPDTPSPSARPPLRVDQNLTDVPPLDNNVSVPVPPQPADQTITESCPIPATSPDPVTTLAINGSIGISNPAHSASDPPPKASTSPPGAVAVPQTAGCHTPPDDPDIPLSHPPTPVLDDMPPTSPLLSSDSPVMTGSDHAPPFPESHSPVLAPAAPIASLPRSASAPDLGVAAAKDGGDPKTDLCKDKDAVDLSSTIRENVVAVLDLPPQSPSQPSVTSIAIAGPSRRSLDAEHTEDHPLHPSHGQYDIV